MSLIQSIAVACGLLATTASTLSVYPHQLAYFNEAAGGPENGCKHLLGSNLGWGQNLLFVKEWYQKNNLGLPLYALRPKYGNPIDLGLPVLSPQIGNGAHDEALGLLAGFHIVGVNSLCGDKAYFVDKQKRLRPVSRHNVLPYCSLQPVFIGGHSLYVFAVLPKGEGDSTRATIPRSQS